MLKIGEIAGFCGLPVKTLRYYNEIGLLKPQYTDPSTKYRFYGEDQLKRLILILDLKDIGLTLAEISLLLENKSNSSLLEDLLKKKILKIKENIKREELKLENVKSILDRVSEEAYKASHTQYNLINEGNENVTTLDTCSSFERHSLDEALWL